MTDADLVTDLEVVQDLHSIEVEPDIGLSCAQRRLVASKQLASGGECWAAEGARHVEVVRPASFR